MTKTKITADGNSVFVTRDDDFGQPVTTEYFAPLAGGYVRIRDRDGRYPQVCKGLSSRGPTLHLSAGASLIALIRRELRRGQAAERREMERS